MYQDAAIYTAENKEVLTSFKRKKYDDNISWDITALEQFQVLITLCMGVGKEAESPSSSSNHLAEILLWCGKEPADTAERNPSYV